jgi:hypothetical protein
MRLLFKARVSIISSVITTKSRWIFITAKSFNWFSPVVFLKYVFNCRKEEKDFSLLAVVTGKVINIFNSRWTIGNIYYCVMPKVQQSTTSWLKNFVSEFKDTFTSDGHVLFCVLCGNFFFLMHILMILEAYLCIF